MKYLRSTTLGCKDIAEPTETFPALYFYLKQV